MKYKERPLRILHICRLFSPHIGGVERHVENVSEQLLAKGNKVSVLTEKYDNSLKEVESIGDLRIVRFNYPKIKYLGLLYIWWQIYKKRTLIKCSDIIHIHDVYVWYLPFRFIFFRKKVFVTEHGYETDRPMTKKSIFQKKLAIKLSNGSVAIGHYLEKYYRIKFDIISYGAARLGNKNTKIYKNLCIFVGRLENDTGLGIFLNWARKHKELNFEFLGNGSLRNQCEKIGRVYGVKRNPLPYLKRAKYCFPGGYLSAIEALNSGCELKLFWDNTLREDVWKMSPFYKLKGEKLRKWAREQTWEKLANEYLDLYNSIK